MAAPLFNQSATVNFATSPASPMTLAWSTSNTIAGSYWLCFVWIDGNGITTTVSDNSSGGGNTWTLLTSAAFTGGTSGTLYVYGAPNTHGGGTKPTVSAAFSGGTASFGFMSLAEYTNVNNSAPTNGITAWLQNDSITTGSTVNGNPVTTTLANDTIILMGYEFSSTATPTAASSYTLRYADTSGAPIRSVLIEGPAATTGTYTPGITFTGGSGTLQLNAVTIALAAATSAVGSSSTSWMTVNLANSLRGVRH